MSVVAAAICIASHLGGNLAIELNFLTLISGILLASTLCGIVKPVDIPMLALVLTPLMWPASIALWRFQSSSAVAISPFSFAIPAFDSFWKYGVPFLYGTLLVGTVFRNSIGRSMRVRLALCIVGLMPIAAIAYLRSKERAAWVTNPCSLEVVNNVADLFAESEN